ncbi:MAG: 30S ribosomal protein S11 [Candidatus Binatia bacterium]|nr:30S ribosomal protein S11 [Candidatus Binatia bacterium]
MADTPKPTTAADLLKDTPSAEAKVPRRKKIKNKVPVAYACIYAGENNTIVTFTDLSGNKLAGSSAGTAGFKGTRKSTPYAAKVAAEQAAERVSSYGVETVHVRVKGLGPGREQAIRGIMGSGINLESIVDITPIPHGGCRPRRRRRV